MALSRSRKIVVGGREYRWKASSRGGLHLAIHDPLKNKKLVAWFEQGTVVTPGVVRKAIETAKPEMWE
jgi:hypothetical protein